MLPRLLQERLYYTLRFAFMKRQNLLRTLPAILARPKAIPRVRREARIVVVGIGVAAKTFLRGLKHNGYTNVTVIAKDQLYGGRCLNHGCMPAEYFKVKQSLRSRGFNEQLNLFIESLRAKLADEFESLEYPFLEDEVFEIKGKTLYLRQGNTLNFDKLVLATGNRIDPPTYIGETFPIERFWGLDAGRLVIVTDNNVSSLSYADMAVDKGMEVTVLFENAPVLAHLPSFQYFVQNLRKRGIQIFSKTRILGRGLDALNIRAHGKTHQIPFDFLIYNGTPDVNLPKVDGKKPNIFDLNFQKASLHGRNDIFLLGDAAGLISATEAELHAKKVVKVFLTGEAVSYAGFSKIPLRIHAQQPLAVVGKPWSLLRRRWKSIDFKTLGWSALELNPGKLWYRYNREQNKLEGIHICHRDAGDLISMASLLIDITPSDPIWTAGFVHPSAAEIFKVLAERIEDENRIFGPKPTCSRTTIEPTVPEILRLPPSHSLLQEAKTLGIFSPEEIMLGLLDPNPSLYFALLWGTKILSKRDERRAISISRSKDGHYQCNDSEHFGYKLANDSGILSLELGERKTTVILGAFDES